MTFVDDTKIIESPITILRYIICILGIFANLVAIIVILVSKDHQKSVTHWYILQLAVADTLFLATLPLVIVSRAHGRWVLPHWMCTADETIKFLNVYASTIFLMVMSFDRYIAICHPMSAKLQKFRKPFSATIITIVVWIVALLLCVPVMMSTFVSGEDPLCKCLYDFTALNPNHDCGESGCELRECKPQEEKNTFFTDNMTMVDPISGGGMSDDPTISGGGMSGDDDTSITRVILPRSTIHPDNLIKFGCGFSEPGLLAFNTFNFIAIFLFPIGMMIACYGLIVHRLSTAQVKSARLTSTSSEASLKRRKSTSATSDYRRRRVTVMCATLVSSFALCWLPFHTFHIALGTGIYGTPSEFCADLQSTAAILAFLNSALNPFLYSFLETNFRKRLRTASVAVRNVFGRHHSSSNVFTSTKAQFRRRERISSTSSNTKTGATKLMRSFTAKPNHGLDTHLDKELTNKETAFFSAEEPKSS